MFRNKFSIISLFTLAVIVFNNFVINLPGTRSYLTNDVSLFLRLPFFLLLFINIGAILLLYKLRDIIDNHKVSFFIGLLIFSRIIFIITRMFLGSLVIDGDVEHFFVIGSEVTHGLYPMAEYPPLAVFYFFLLNLLSWDNLEVFTLFIPIFNLFWEILIIYILYKISIIFKNELRGKLLILLYILNPFILFFFLARFDLAAVVLGLLAMYFFVQKRVVLFSVMILAAALMKLFPIVLLPFFMLLLLKERSWGWFVRVLITLAIIITIFSGFFLLTNKVDRLKYMVSFQNRRTMQGESIYYLPSFILEPNLRIKSTGLPWEEVPSKIFGNKKIMMVQILLTSIPLLLFLFTKKTLSAAIIFSLSSISIFTLLNRIYSPQFFIFSLISYLTILIIVKVKEQSLIMTGALISVAAGANFFVWPLFAANWLLWETIFFLTNLLLILYFLRAGIKGEQVQLT